MTIETLIEAECAKSGSAWFHKSEIKPLLLELLKKLNPDQETELRMYNTIKELEK